MGSDTVDDRLASIELRLARIEKNLRIFVPDTPVATRNPWQEARNAPAAQTYAEPEAEPGNWLGIIAIICFVLAAGFIIKLSIESGWLTPERQIGIAAMLGFSLIGAGFALLRSDRSYASLLPGAGIIVLYLTAFAAHSYYELIPFHVAIGLSAVISSICIWLYIQIKHDAYAITAAIGSYIAPVVLGLHAEAVFSLYYFLLCSVAFATISVCVQSHALTLISAYLAILLSAAAGMNLNEDALLAGLLAVHFLIFSVGTYFYTAHHKLPLSETEAWSFLPVLLIFYTVEYHLIDRIQPGLAPWASLGFAGVLIGLYLSARKLFPDGLGSQTLILAFATLAGFHSIYLELLPDMIRPWLFVMIMLAAVVIPMDMSKTQKGNPFYIPALAIIAILGIEYLRMLSHLLQGDGGAWVAVSFAAVASIWAFITIASDKVEQQPTYGHALLGAAHLLAVSGLYRLTYDVGSLAVSASWLFYGVGVIAFAFMRKDEVMAKSALFVLAFAAGKALLYDAASAPTIVRIFCLLLTGAVLYGCGLFMRKIGDWSDQRNP